MIHFARNKKNNKSGFSIFLAVIMVGALLVVAVSVSSISSRSLKDLIIGKESQMAFFAADAGLECALYWDTFTDNSYFDPSTANTIVCNGNSVSGGVALANGETSLIGGGGLVSPTSKFFVNIGSQSEPCAYVTVYKDPSGSTQINSYGYNICDFNSDKILERGVDLSY